jgi:hypothetical protein
VTYELTGDLLATAVCRCTHGQRQSGGALSVNLVAHESQLTVSGELKTYEETGERGDAGLRPAAALRRVRLADRLGAGPVGGRRRGQGRDPGRPVRRAPTIEVWCVDRQPWVALPVMALPVMGLPVTGRRWCNLSRHPEVTGLAAVGTSWLFVWAIQDLKMCPRELLKDLNGL